MLKKSCIIIGGSSQAGSWLAPRLIDEGWNVQLVSRGKKPMVDHGSSATWHCFDVHSEFAPPTLRGEIVFSTLGNASYWLNQSKTVGIERIISFSSTSILTKELSRDPDDARMVKEVSGREQSFIETC